MPLISFQMYSTIQNQLNLPVCVRACLQKYNKGHLFGKNKSIGIKVHLHRNQSEIDFQIHIEYAFIVFYWMKIAFFGY